MDAALDRGGVRLEIPLPPSWNRVFKARAMPIGGGRFTAQVYKTAEGKEYAEKVQALCVAQGLRPFPREQMLRLSGIVAMQRAGCDLDDRLKVSLDALQGFVFENDEQVAELAVRRIVDPKRPGLRVVFEPIPFDRYGNPTR
ncbi:MAG: RusA family crossover junction endodeoxyribonuclease [Myxococcota bacterium]